MHTASPHPQESQRLESLRRLALLDTPREEEYDRIAWLAAHVAQTPVALITLVDEDRQFFKAGFGLGEVRETPRDVAFCAHAILQPDRPLIVCDATQDPRFAANPLVVRSPEIRMYAAVPLLDPRTSLPLGTLCVVDRRPRALDELQLQALGALAAQVMRLFELRLARIESEQQSERLALAAAEASRAHRARGDFLAAIRRELRTPIGDLAGAIELLDDPALEEKHGPALHTLRTRTRSLRYLVEDVLDLPKPELDVLERHDAVPIRRAIENTMGVIHDLVGGEDVELEVRVASTVPEALELDGGRLHQILLQLLANAVRFTAEGRVGVDARHDGEMLHLTVRDTGQGIAPELVEQIFEPVDQVPGRRITGQGTGLGLSIVRGVVRRLGGRITVHSELGQGTRFDVWVPARTAMQCVNEPVEASSPGRALAVMIADDDPVDREVVAAMLRRLGARPVLAQDGVEAVRRFASCDAILIDCDMPGLDGFGATRRIRREEAHRRPIVALTAGDPDDDRRKCRDAGMDDMVTKPLSLQQLSGLLQRWAATPGDAGDEPLADTGS